MRFAALLALLTACQKPKQALSSLQPAPGATFEVIAAPNVPSGDTGYWPNLLVDGAGGLHAAYCDGYMGDAKIAHRQADGTWTQETVEDKGAVGKYMSAVWGKDGPELVYLDQTRKTLRYAKKPKDKWEFADIASDKEDIGISGHFMITPAGERLYIYYNTRNELMLATLTGNAWAVSKLATAGAVHTLQLDAQVTEHGVRLAYPDWQVSHSILYVADLKGMDGKRKVDDEGIAGLKTQFVGKDIFYINARGGLLFRMGEDDKREQLFDNVANFRAQTMADGRVALALQVGRQDGLGEGALWLAWGKASKWTLFTLDEVRPVGQYLSTAETNGTLNIAYYDGVKKQLKLARVP